MAETKAGGGYPTDVTETEWAMLEPLLTKAAGGPGRPRTVELRRVVNGLRYVERTGCQWRLVPLEFGYWGTIRYYFDVWTRDGTLVRVNRTLRERVREEAGRQSTPSAAIVDSQTAKTTAVGGDRGFDGGKKNHRTQTTYPGGYDGAALAGGGAAG